MFFLKECDVSSAFTSTPDKKSKVQVLARSEDILVMRALLENRRSLYTGPEHTLWIDEFEGWD